MLYIYCYLWWLVDDEKSFTEKKKIALKSRGYELYMYVRASKNVCVCIYFVCVCIYFVCVCICRKRGRQKRMRNAAPALACVIFGLWTLSLSCIFFKFLFQNSHHYHCQKPPPFLAVDIFCFFYYHHFIN